DDPWNADVGVTGVAAAIADSGTLVLTAGAGTPRGTSLVPPVHVAVVPFGRLVADLGRALELVAALRPPPSGVQLITGPSRSGDIEMQLVRGVHGPREVHVLLHPR
ncbi:MAG: LUD domain-containing protein, partial [Actinomycetota bacterium]|nr:LUD domain-containing protein [Actinomycetota bacterium]